jgi:tetratricopeptide (TPR) repeat protein
MLRRVAAGALETSLIVFCGFMAAFGQSAQPDNAAKEAMGRAHAAYQNNDYALARRESEGALAIRKDWAEPYLLLGKIAWREGKVGDAIKSVKEAIKYQSDYPEAHYVMGKLYFEKRDWKQAEKEANLALSQGSKSADIHVLLGDIALVREQCEPALKFFNLALAQPSLDSKLRNEAAYKIDALKNSIEFQANKENPDWQFPRLIGPIISTPTNNGRRPPEGWARIGGVINSFGFFAPSFIIDASDKDVGEFFWRQAFLRRFTPAKRQGMPLSFWYILDFKTLKFPSGAQ